VAEQPVGAEDPAPPRAEHAEGNGVAASDAVPPTAYPAYFPFPYQLEPPRVVIKADLLPAWSVLSTVSLLGLAVGWLWSRLAPPQRMVITQDGTPVPLPAESYHRADGLVLFVMLGLAAGLLTGLAVWFLRERRGPVVMIGAMIGSALGGWLATQVGTSWADGRFPIGAHLKAYDVILQAPQLESKWVLVAWPMVTALVYGVLAAWNAMDDLGRRLG
jgi:uncharacterized protein DUF2567